MLGIFFPLVLCGVGGIFSADNKAASRRFAASFFENSSDFLADMPITDHCVFCGNHGLTMEHIWPKWLKKVAPKDYQVRGGNFHNTGQTKIVAGGEPTRNNETRWHTGPIVSRKLKIVCASCNNGWMSQLQQRAKPVLAPLIKGDWSEFSPEKYDLLAAWATMFTMVIEFADMQTLTSTAIDRKLFSETNAAIPGWMIWMGHAPVMPWQFYHQGWAVSDIAPVPGDPPFTCESQTTFFGVGKLLVHTYSTRNPIIDVHPNTFAIKHGLNVVWPRQEFAFVNTTNPKLISPDEVKAVAYDLVDRCGIPHQKAPF